MLVLSRKKYESIVIDDNIRITAVGLRNGKVRLGVECPKDIPVCREEIYEKIKVEEGEFPNVEVSP